jgi:hypothetical protein
MANTQTLIERNTMTFGLCKGVVAGEGGQQQLCITVVAIIQILRKVVTEFVVVHDHLIVIQRRLVIKGPASTV